MTDEPIKILVVEDEDDIAHFTCKILEREGFRALKALDGKTALALFNKEQPAILMLDLDLGYSDIKGAEVLDRIKAAAPDTQCVVITRVTDPDVKAKVTEMGIHAYLNKPLYPQDWLPLIRQAADRIKEGA
jgi:DNA-binding response OmpR family regulator